MTNLADQFDLLGRKQLAIQEGIHLLEMLRGDLSRSRASADAWGVAAVMANVTLIPLNVIVNAFELKAANTAYQAFVRALYGKFGKSGSRIGGPASQAFSLVKDAIIDELKRRALTEFVPGVNILVGLAQDSFAAWKVMQTVASGGHEMAMLASQLESKIANANRQLVQIGIRRAEVLARIGQFIRTA